MQFYKKAITSKEKGFSAYKQGIHIYHISKNTRVETSSFSSGSQGELTGNWIFPLTEFIFHSSFWFI